MARSVFLKKGGLGLYYIYHATACSGTIKVSLALRSEFHCTRRHGKNGVILTKTDAGTGADHGAALAQDNLSGLDLLAVSSLYAEVFRI